MLTQGEDVEAQALRSRGWSISAIARHLNRDPKTIRAYLAGQRRPGERASSRPDPLAPFVAYLSARFVDDPHLWATALFDELVPLGYAGSYVSFARQLRRAGLRPHCEACAGVNGRNTIEIDHPAGEEMQWDWFERRRAPWGGTAYVLLGTLPHSSRVRGVLAESMDQPHLIEAIDAVLRRHGGTPRVWRTDRLATVIVPGSRDVQPSFAPVAKHYGAIVEPCPPRRGNRKGAVESSVRYLCGRWWRTMTATSPEDAQRSLDVFCAGPGDARLRGTVAGPVTVGVLAEAEPLLALPAAPYPATLTVSRTVGDNAAVAFRGNSYSVPPGMAGVVLRLSHRLGSATMQVASPAGGVLVSHRLAPAGAGTLVRTAAHRAALERVVLSAFTTERPCERKANRPPGSDARAEAAKLLSGLGSEVVIDLARYGELAGTSTATASTETAVAQ
ncbi:MAG TPA: helix-turn-helix domain-containing protein [Acidimicrobiales bacterium]|nr:helix-turn-helix domain-containing protein [Acidimicrobiales bacterium]